MKLNIQYIRTRKNTHTHTHTHTYIYIYIYNCSRPSLTPIKLIENCICQKKKILILTNTKFVGLKNKYRLKYLIG
jgi:hypothetical protein